VATVPFHRLLPSTETVIRCAAVSIAITISARAVLDANIGAVAASMNDQSKHEIMPEPFMALLPAPLYVVTLDIGSISLPHGISCRRKPRIYALVPSHEAVDSCEDWVADHSLLAPEHFVALSRWHSSQGTLLARIDFSRF
jgi:hypothetical protein